MRTPVALIIFNRPHHTARVFAEIAKARPERLLLIADGPRPDRPEDVQRCAAVRDIVAHVDWPCQVERNFAESNLGCGRRPGSGISWVFEQVDEAIILEDDCVPDPTFFRVREELLEKYREDERVMNIGGMNGQRPPPESPSSYFFSISNITWGWGDVAAGVEYYDRAVRLWPEFRDTSWLLDLVRDARVAKMFAHAFERAYAAQGELEFRGLSTDFRLPGRTTACRSSPRPRWSRTWDLGLRRRIRSRWGCPGSAAEGDHGLSVAPSCHSGPGLRRRSVHHRARDLAPGATATAIGLGPSAEAGRRVARGGPVQK